MCTDIIHALEGCGKGMRTWACRATSVALLALACLVATGPAGASDRWEREQLSRPYAQAIERSHRRCADPAIEERVRRVVERLLMVIDEPEHSWRVVVLQDPVPNAFALPNGYIYVHTGLLEMGPPPTAHPLGADREVPPQMGDDELAFVLAHEMTHVVRDHVIQLRRADHSMGRTLAIGGLQRSVLGRVAGQLLKGAATSEYSREYEAEADEWGLRYATLAGFDAGGAMLAFERLRIYEQSHPVRTGIFANHPSTPERLEHLRRLLASTTQLAPRGNLKGKPVPGLPTLWVAYEGAVAEVPVHTALDKDPRFATSPIPRGQAGSPAPQGGAQERSLPLGMELPRRSAGTSGASPATTMADTWVNGLAELCDCCNLRLQAFPSLEAVALAAGPGDAALRDAMRRAGEAHEASMVLVLHKVELRRRHLPWPGGAMARVELDVSGFLLVRGGSEAFERVAITRVRESVLDAESPTEDALAMQARQDAVNLLHDRIRAASKASSALGRPSPPASPAAVPASPLPPRW